MKKTKLGAGLLVIITVAATAAAGAAYISRDREGPAIIFDESTQTSYYSGITEEELLGGVRAEDSRDGDVTDSLMVEKVNELGSQAVVTYVAMDSRYNVTKEERILEIDGGSGAEVSPTPTPTPEPENEETAATPETPTQAVTVTPTPTEDASEESQRTAQMEANIAALPAGSPALRLSQHVLSISAGSEFNQLAYVDSITDDVDTSDLLFTQIQIVGTVDTATPGTYSLTYYVYDSDGNISNEDVLEVTVV
ncbi:MAG TPA: DUF5011 domain-containing protein [Candidatus Scatomonas pullistercoris]|uniref:DUF5011 domain-containing protein n=1 Tax=Candidatus Scatomonas pullistercoris TaxID=2840920 RepID=A0A9D1TAB8_9FIRM|nr:DUF5011 domain-containing protein [Candidatus Scatomonas pullistercoris]